MRPHPWLTANLEGFFMAEIRNERAGGVTPATLRSAIDSLSQAPEVFGLSEFDLLSLLVMTAEDPEREVVELIA